MCSQIGKVQKTLANCIEKQGIGLHSGRSIKVQLWPEFAKKGRYFKIGSNKIESSINFVQESPLCTTLCKDGIMVSTVEHLLSALEGTGVDNCCIEITASDSNDPFVEVFYFTHLLALLMGFIYLVLIMMKCKCFVKRM